MGAVLPLVVLLAVATALAAIFAVLWLRERTKRRELQKAHGLSEDAFQEAFLWPEKVSG